MINRIILIGGGDSIREGEEKGLWDKLKNEFTIGMNRSMFFHEATVQTFFDRDCYIDFLDKVVTLPLVVTRFHVKIHDESGWPFNVILIPTVEISNKYDDFKKGCGLYAPKLVGFMALSLAILLKPKNIYLIGFDWTQESSADKTEGGEIKILWYKNDAFVNESSSFIYSSSPGFIGQDKIIAYVTDNADTVEQEWIITVKTSVELSEFAARTLDDENKLL